MHEDYTSSSATLGYCTRYKIYSLKTYIRFATEEAMSLRTTNQVSSNGQAANTSDLEVQNGCKNQLRCEPTMVKTTGQWLES